MEKQRKSLQPLSDSNQALILYIYDDIERYIANILLYIKAGVKCGHHLFIIENAKIYEQIKIRLKDLLSDEEEVYLHFEDNKHIIRYYKDVYACSLHHFRELLDPYFVNHCTVRTWFHLEWNSQDNILPINNAFEKVIEESISSTNSLFVCACYSNELPASLQMKMMRSYSYFMTDNEVVKSPLYKK